MCYYSTRLNKNNNLDKYKNKTMSIYHEFMMNFYKKIICVKKNLLKHNYLS